VGVACSARLDMRGLDTDPTPAMLRESGECHSLQFIANHSANKQPFGHFRKNEQPSTKFGLPFSRGQFILNPLFCWCREGGSNPHDRKGRRILSPLRLPVPPSRPGVGWLSKRHPKYRTCFAYDATDGSFRTRFAFEQGLGALSGARTDRNRKRALAR
jgi:hypothetical protein